MPNYYTAITTGEEVDAAALNQRLTELDEQIFNLADGAGYEAQPANRVLAGPTDGADAAPAFRTLVAADLADILAPLEAQIAALASDLAQVQARTHNRLYVSGLEVEAFAGKIATIHPGACLSDDETELIEAPATIEVDLAMSGINGLDTGDFAADTWYYVWLVKGASGVGGLLSLSSSAPVLPAGYDEHKRRLAPVRTTGTAPPDTQIHLQRMPRGQGASRRVYYATLGRAAPGLILNEVNIGDINNKTEVDCSALVPPTARFVIAMLETNTPSASVTSVLWTRNSATSGHHIFRIPGTGAIFSVMMDLEVNESGIGYLWALGSADEDLSFEVRGYIDEGLAVLGYTP